MQLEPVEQYKKQAGEMAADRIQSGMTIGLGTGSTAVWMVRRLAERLNQGEVDNIIGIPTSERTRAEAEKLGIPLSTLGEHPNIDLTIDGADEIDPDLNLIKGGGGALLREKMVAQASDKFLIVGAASKQVGQLGSTFKLPVEVVKFGHEIHQAFLQALGAKATLRQTERGRPYLTDGDHLIYDCDFGPISDVYALARTLNQRAGVVEHGLFIDLASEAIVVGEAGVIILQKD